MVELRNNYPVEVFDDKTAAQSLPQTDNKNYKTLGFKPINKEILEAYHQVILQLVTM
ncbi:hypothetical protein [Rickettsia conorii]|uniref:Acyl-[acyl-carrier-protein]--UDP-N-acetylglucosamine O-acyltransferase n=2 Tax=Rickettsia conorii TaxID=781 RepID=A0ABY4U354_RICCR|nr:hypothetical protein [Rickettsia conorii]URW78297.1 hypothetical protein NBT09_02980 [Rickettsia conorii subsp. raoultii]